MPFERIFHSNAWPRSQININKISIVLPVGNTFPILVNYLKALNA